MVQKQFVSLIATAALVLAVAGVARADGLPSRPPKDRDCVYKCRAEARTCVGAARTAARMCAQEKCSAELDAAHKACSADSASAECEAAVKAARECLQPCAEELRADLRECRSDVDTCVADCPDRTPPPVTRPDPTCVASCRQALGTCVGTARDEARACGTECQPLIDDAHSACEADKTSDACHAARQAARECLQKCGAALQAATKDCLGKAQKCVAACPDSQPSTGVRPRLGSVR